MSKTFLNVGLKQIIPCKAWVSDITYILVKEGFVYLTTVIDLYDRKLISWSISKIMNTEDTTLAAFKMARKDRRHSHLGYLTIEEFNQTMNYRNVT